jgi:lipopolysaccharide transport system ATP-binding protein
MSESIICAENVSKRYVLGHQLARGDGLRHVIESAIRNPLRWLRARREAAAKRQEEFWALKDVSFEIKPGQVVGFIGRNGAGKSTLLKILSRITQPTSGRIHIRGRIASLLEVGTGFHPELTGRENVFLNGAILGMRRAEIIQKFDEIVEFSGVEKFLDTPVKRYSSGMYVRLAFAVAAHLQPEILIVDEVLAVGDAEFQKKCLGKMQDVSRGGRTVLFVSHNLTALSSLCTRAVLLESGRKKLDGGTEEVISAYMASGAGTSAETSWEPSNTVANNGRLRLAKARVLSADEITGEVEIDKPTTLQYDFEVLQDGMNVSSSIHLFDKQGNCVLASGTVSKILKPGIYQHSCVLPAHFLNNTHYSANVILLTDVGRLEVLVRDAFSFMVYEKQRDGEYVGEIIGCVRPRLEWQHKTLRNGTTHS